MPKLKKMARSLGFEIEMRKDRVKFRFKPSIWANLCNTKGDLLPSCCAAISTIRDCFINALREDGWMQARDLQRVAVNASGHEFKPDHPVSQVVRVYEAFQDRLRFDTPHATDPKDPDGCVDRIALGEIWKWSCRHSYEETFKETSCRSQANINYGLFHIAPTIGLLARKIQDLALPPVEGFAITMRSGKIYETPGGDLAIFPEQDEAESLLRHWIKTKQVAADDATIQRCRVSFENGIEILG